MKSLKLLAVGALALACVQVSHAQTVIRFTGSTAYRANAMTAILHALGSTDGVTLTSGSYAYAGSTLGGANQAIFYGTLTGTAAGANNGTAVIIATDWTGSEGGIEEISNPTATGKISFLPTTTPGTSGGTSVAAGTDAQFADICFSDTAQTASQFLGNVSIVPSGGGRAQTKTFPAITEDGFSPLGVVPFKWLGSRGGPGDLTNVTADALFSFYKNGLLPLTQFTGVLSDSTTTIYAAGRDIDSGTRLTALADTGVGIGAQSVQQYQPTDSNGAQVSSTSSTIASAILFPAATIDGVAELQGNGGYASGGNLSKAMGAVTSGTGPYFIAYLGVNDADQNGLPAGAVELTYQGVGLGVGFGVHTASGLSSVNYNASATLTGGQYTFWSFEHEYYYSTANTNPAGFPIVQSVADLVGFEVQTRDAQVLLSSMHATRAGDGGHVTFTH